MRAGGLTLGTVPVAWRGPLAALTVTAAGLLALFHRDVADLAAIYSTSTTFGHCLFVLPIVGWLVWTRREGLARLTPGAWWVGLGLVATGAAAWFAGTIGGVAFARHLGLVGMLAGSAVALLGPAVSRALAFPLAYLAFLIPFGTWLETPLQTLTVRMVMPLLAAVGVPARVDGVLITVPGGWFEVAEACSGAKFVIAMIAYATLVAHVGFTGWRRRVAFFAVAMVVPVVANGVRAFATIWAAHLTSVEAATGFDHIVYGWVFFALVMAAVLALGWRWFDRDPAAPAFDAGVLAAIDWRRADRWSVAGAILGAATLAYAAGTLAAARADALPARLMLPDVPGWERVALDPAAAWGPNYPTSDHALLGRYRAADGRAVDVAAAVYAGQHEGAELIAFGQGPVAEGDRWVRVGDEAGIAGGSVMRIVAPGPVARTVTNWYRVAGVTTGSGVRVKIATAWAKLVGGPQRATALHVSAVGEPAAARGAIAAFVRAAGGPARIADGIAAGR